MAEIHDHAITMTFMARGGRHAAVLATDIQGYVHRRGGMVVETAFTPPLTTEEREQAQEIVLREAVDPVAKIKGDPGSDAH